LKESGYVSAVKELTVWMTGIVAVFLDGAADPSSLLIVLTGCRANPDSHSMRVEGPKHSRIEVGDSLSSSTKVKKDGSCISTPLLRLQIMHMDKFIFLLTAGIFDTVLNCFFFSLCCSFFFVRA
jgi:hypothetical protein